MYALFLYFQFWRDSKDVDKTESEKVEQLRDVLGLMEKKDALEYLENIVRLQWEL